MLFIVATLASCIISGTTCNGESHAGNAGRFMKDDSSCAIPVRTKSGWVCGTERASYDGVPYASFRGIPYARQPLGELRFVAPQPLEPWKGYFNASVEGPVCVQRIGVFGPMLQPVSMGEDCLRVNVHVPMSALPARGERCAAGLHVLVYVHGGGFQTGSGDSDINAPEYMLDRNVILVTFNYRLGPFGFLWLNSSSVPGNTGLRDQVAALRWVQDNARSFGGDPDRVTLMGQSTGASCAHILSLSEAVQGLFTKVILMSGTASFGYFSATQSYALYIKNMFLEYLAINSTDAEEIHRRLIKLPYDTILDANEKVLKTTRFSAFNHVVESQFDGVTTILDQDPDILVANGRGSDYPLLVGCTNVECEFMRHRLEDIDIIGTIQEDATAILTANLLFSTTDEERRTDADQMADRYFNGTATLDKYIVSCSDSFFIYPALKLAKTRASDGGAPVYLYQFSYNSEFVPVKQAFQLNYTGAAHLDDLSYVLRVNSILGNTTLDRSDERVKDWMITAVSNFVYCSNPTCRACDSSWPPVTSPLQYQAISGAEYATSGLSAAQQDMIRLFDSFYDH